MKTRRNLIAPMALAATSLSLLTGCFSKPQPPIHFSDEGEIASKTEAAVAVASPKVVKLSKVDALQVDLVVYGYLLKRDFWDTHEYTAVFIQGSNAEVNLVRKQFAGHNPPIKTPDRAQLAPNRTPVDKETGKPAMILSVEIADPAGDTVQAIGRWYGGGAMSGFYQFDLKKNGAAWEIENVK